MKIRNIRASSLAVAAVLVALAVAPAALAADVVDIGYLDQGQIAAIPAFATANREINAFGTDLQRQYTDKARNASPSRQQQLASEFQGKMADKQRQLLGPLFGRAQVAIASAASSKNLSVVMDKRIVIYGGVDITGQVHDLLTAPAPPVPPSSTPPPSTVGYVDQQQLDAVPKIRSATDDFAKFKADQGLPEDAVRSPDANAQADRRPDAQRDGVGRQEARARAGRRPREHHLRRDGYHRRRDQRAEMTCRPEDRHGYAGGCPRALT
jgi:outer membrane protein